MSTNCEPQPTNTGNVTPVLHEIGHALQRWVEDGTPHIIDLRAMPMAPQEVDELINELGEGEIEATLTVLGKSIIRETRYPGVWLVTHYNTTDGVDSRSIEITDIPALLKSQQADIQAGLQQLNHRLEEGFDE